MHHMDRNTICNLMTKPLYAYAMDLSTDRQSMMVPLILVRNSFSLYVCFAYHSSESYIFGRLFLFKLQIWQ